MKEFFSLLFTFILCAFVFTVPINASEKKKKILKLLKFHLATQNKYLEHLAFISEIANIL